MRYSCVEIILPSHPGSGDDRLSGPQNAALFTVLVAGGIVAWRGVRTGSALWVALGVGVAVALALLMLFPDRLAVACGLLTATFVGASVLSVASGAVPTGLVLLGWAVGFAWVGYQNRPTTEN